MAQSDFEQESTANATWSRMLQGNRRFAEGKPDHPWQDEETRQTLLDGQNPDAAVLSCSDSRVPPEIIFDQGLGDLFTVRTAGQLIDSAVIASLEYAVKKLHVSLICVLGHEHCGAIEAAEQELDDLMHTITSEADGSLEPRMRWTTSTSTSPPPNRLFCARPACPSGRRAKPSSTRMKTSSACMWPTLLKLWWSSLLSSSRPSPLTSS